MCVCGPRYLCVWGVERSNDLFASLVITCERHDASRDSRAYRVDGQGTQCGRMEGKRLEYRTA